jgi:hypothetical protein
VPNGRDRMTLPDRLSAALTGRQSALQALQKLGVGKVLRATGKGGGEAVGECHPITAVWHCLTFRETPGPSCER